MGIAGAGGVALVAVVALGVVATAVHDDEDSSSRKSAVVTRVIDGDTVQLESGDHVRLIGVDTPEHGRCGFDAATEAMRRMVEGQTVELINPASVEDRDAYERLLRYVEVEEKDAGFSQIRAGRGVARYDSRDGYDPHPRELRYRQTDRRHEGACQR